MNERRALAVWLVCVGFAGGIPTAQGEDEAMKTETRDVRVTMKGKPVTLAGVPVKEGTAAPDFKVVDAAFKPVKLSDLKGQVVLISAVPSLDTGVCSIQTKRFNDEAALLPTNVVVLTISEDLPFAQKRFCEAEKVQRIQVLSDSVSRDFGNRYGILIPDMGLLARSVWVIGRDGKVAYRQIVSEMSTEPDYAAALKAAREAAQ
jgi:thioredoxin-dependent peroxiredoxin